MNKNRTLQYLATFAVSLAAIANSASYYWTAPILPKFYNNETSISITSSEISWVVAMISPGAVSGSLISRSVSDKFGRRATLVASTIPYIVGTLFVLTATRPWMLYLARFCWGCGCGMAAVVSSMYLSEIADKEIRGTLNAVSRVMFSFGAFVVLVVGSLVTYEALGYFLLVLPICYFIACWCVPESPYYLLKVGKVDAARKALLRLSGNEEVKVVEEKLSLMRSDVRKEMLRSSSVKELFTGKQYRKAIIISAGLKIFQTMSGTVPVQQYLGRIIQESNSGIKVSTALIIFGAVRSAVGFVTPVIIDKVGRRPLLMWSFLGAGVMLGAVGTYFFIQRIVGFNDDSSNPFRFIVLIGINSCVVISIFGYETLSYVIPSEIFPLNVRSVALTTLNIFTAFLNFTVVKEYQIMKDWTGLYGVFWFYSSMACSGAVFAYFVVPETRGKSLREIQIELQGNIYDDADETLRQIDVLNDNVPQNTELKDIVGTK